uniref:Uncharacterized protein n=1 Tax=Tanacetum cinerariifolium TaxID=118510 RepID=A0A699JJ76_TANCI|nr:hypothetical protein [Tanacetum cinerariifolium]
MTADQPPLTDGPVVVNGGPAMVNNGPPPATVEAATWHINHALQVQYEEEGSVRGQKGVSTRSERCQYEVRESSILEADMAQGDWWIGN